MAFLALAFLRKHNAVICMRRVAGLIPRGIDALRARPCLPLGSTETYLLIYQERKANIWNMERRARLDFRRANSLISSRHSCFLPSVRRSSHTEPDAAQRPAFRHESGKWVLLAFGWRAWVRVLLRAGPGAREGLGGGWTWLSLRMCLVLRTVGVR